MQVFFMTWEENAMLKIKFHWFNILFSFLLWGYVMNVSVLLGKIWNALKLSLCKCLRNWKLNVVPKISPGKKVKASALMSGNLIPATYIYVR